MAPREKMRRISGKVDDVDRISRLPSDIIDQILELLPIKDAIRTGVLSSQWRYRWARLKKLELDHNFFSAVLDNYTCPCEEASEPDDENISICERTISPDRFARIDLVNRVLLCHAGPIHNLSISIPHWFPRNVDLNHLIQLVSGKSVKQLILINYQPWSDGIPMMKVPPSLFSGEGFDHLSYLTLNCFDLVSLPATFKGFPSLTRLKVMLPAQNIIHQTSINELENLVSKCLQLEILELNFIGEQEFLTFRAPKLRETLIIFGFFSNIYLKKPVYIKKLCLQVYLKPEWEITRIIELFSCLIHVEMLNLGGVWVMDKWPTNVGPSGKLKSPPELRLLKHFIVGVKLDTHFMSFFLFLFRMAPRLEKLKIGSSDAFEQSTDIMTVEEDCRLDHLKKAEVMCYYHVASKLVKLILSASPALEVLTISTNLQDEKQLKEDILQYHRASPNVEIIFKIVECLKYTVW